MMAASAFRQGRRRPLATLLGLLLLWLARPRLLDAGPTPVPVLHADQVKAAYIYNFLKFIEWPAEVAARQEFVIGTLGRDAVTREIEQTLSGQLLNGRPIVVRAFARPADARDAQVLYVAASETSDISFVVERLRGASVLTIASSRELAELGCVMWFELEGNRVRFGVHLAAAERARLRFSSQLLKLALLIPE